MPTNRSAIVPPGPRSIFPRQLLLARLLLLALSLALLAGTACRALAPAPTPTPLPTTTPTAAAPTNPPAPTCDYDPAILDLLSQTSSEQWLGWVARLSGAEPITIAGQETRIRTRSSPEMFSGNPDARAVPYVLEVLGQWYLPEQITLQNYPVSDPEGGQHTWQNIILTLPGNSRPDEIVILAAHLDSTSEQPDTDAPGAEDNASGAAALLEAARLFHRQQFARTVQLVWFSGEEQGLLGSAAFVSALPDPAQVVGVINLDMFGYDSDGDRCFELHVGALPASDAVASCFVGAIDAYSIDLPRPDYLTGAESTDRSDHGSFWRAGIGAVEVLQNMFDNQQPSGCANADPSPYYHTTEDTLERMNAESAIAIVRAALATAAALAGMQ